MDEQNSIWIFVMLTAAVFWILRRLGTSLRQHHSLSRWIVILIGLTCAAIGLWFRLNH